MMSNWTLIFILTMVTFFNRYAFFSDRIKFLPNKKVAHLLSFSAQAVMTALWVPIVFSYDKQNGFGVIDYHYLLPTAIVFILALLRVNMLLVIAIGMGVFYLSRYLY